MTYTFLPRYTDIKQQKESEADVKERKWQNKILWVSWSFLDVWSALVFLLFGSVCPSFLKLATTFPPFQTPSTSKNGDFPPNSNMRPVLKTIYKYLLAFRTAMRADHLIYDPSMGKSS